MDVRFFVFVHRIYLLIFHSPQIYIERYLWTMGGRLGRDLDTSILNLCLRVEDPHEDKMYATSGPNAYISEWGGGTKLHRDAILAATNSLLAGTLPHPLDNTQSPTPHVLYKDGRT